MDLRCSTHPPPSSSDEEDEDDEDDALVMTLVAVPRRLVFTQKLLFVCFLSSPKIMLPEKKSLADTKTREAPRLPSRPPRPPSCSCTRGRATTMMPFLLRGPSAPPLFLCDHPKAKETFFFFAIIKVAFFADKEEECEEHTRIVVVIAQKRKHTQHTPKKVYSSPRVIIRGGRFSNLSFFFVFFRLCRLSSTRHKRHLYYLSY